MPHHRAALRRTVVAHPCRQQAAVLEISEQADGAGPSEGKLRIGPMLGFKRSRTAPMTLEGIDLLLRLRTRQFAKPDTFSDRLPRLTRQAICSRAGTARLAGAPPPRRQPGPRYGVFTNL